MSRVRSLAHRRGRLTMRKFLFFASTITTLAAAISLPAGAATPANFTLTAGALSISAPLALVPLGTQVASINATTISGPLGVVTVSDQRGGAVTWTASVISTAFTPVPGGPTVGAANVSYAAGPITPPER